MSQIKMQKKTNDMSKKIKQTTFQIGFKNHATTTADLSVPEGYMLVEKEEHNKRLEEHKERLEDKLQIKELALKNAHNDEKMQLYAHIYDLKNSLANLPDSLKKEQEKNAELVALLEQMGSKVAEKKFKKAMDAFNETEFSKADKILAEIEDNEKISKKEFGVIAYTRGEIAEQDIRWHAAAKHYTRAAQLDPCFLTLIMAERLAIDIGDYDSALSFGEEAKKAAFKEHGEDSEEYATSLGNLGLVHIKQKKYKLAEQLHTEALEIRQNKLGKKHPDVANSLNNLGGIYQEQGQYTKAKYFFRRALNIYKETLGAKHPSTAEALINLGGAYRELGEFREAKPRLKQALNIQEKILGINHPHTANSFNNLGGIYQEQKQYRQALPMFQQALEILEATLGLEHPNTKKARINYEKTKKCIANAEKPHPNKNHNITKPSVL